MATATAPKPPRAHGRRRRFALQLPLGLLIPTVGLVVWEWAAQAGYLPPWQVPAPSDIYYTLIDLFASGDLWVHMGASLRRVMLGFALGGGAGLLVGLSVGLSKVVERLLGTTLQAIKSVPSLGWVPLLILWFGIGEASKLTLIAIGAFFPVYVNVVAGLKGVERKLIEVGQVQGLSHLAILVRIMVPSAMPSLLTGLRVGLTQGWLFMVIAELMAASEGLGFLLSMGREVGRPDLLLGSLVLLALLGKVTDTAMAWIERRALKWRDTAEDA